MNRRKKLLLSFLIWLNVAIAWACAAQGQVGIYFWQPSCPDCPAMSANVEALAKEGFVIRKVNTDSDQSLVSFYQVTKTPTFISFVTGQKVDTAVSLATMRKMLTVSKPVDASKPAWWTFSPSNAANNQGIYLDVVSRVPPGELASLRSQLAAQGANEPSTVTHEATHFIDSHLSQRMGQSYGAVYVGNGRCLMFREPRVTIGQVAAVVPTEYRAGTFTTYLTGDRTTRNALALLDEFTCYANDSQCTREMHLREDGGLQRAGEMSRYCDVMVDVIRQNDPEYAQLPELINFIAWQKLRIQQLGGGR